MRKLLILITLCLPVVVWAQDMRKITGRVLEAASGEPLPRCYGFYRSGCS